MGELRTRYLNREGGYTRVVRTEPKNTYDQGESAILELVDGPKDSRFMMTAKTVARDRTLGQAHTPVTRMNISKVTKFRGVEEFEKMVQKFLTLDFEGSVQEPAEPEVLSQAELEGAKMAEREGAAASEIAAKFPPSAVKDEAKPKDARSNQ